jgi:hypothetical protein
MATSRQPGSLQPRRWPLHVSPSSQARGLTLVQAHAPSLAALLLALLASLATPQVASALPPMPTIVSIGTTSENTNGTATIPAGTKPGDLAIWHMLYSDGTPNLSRPADRSGETVESAARNARQSSATATRDRRLPPHSIDPKLRDLGSTDAFGNVTVRPGLAPDQLRATLRHESVHRFFSVRYGPFKEARASLLNAANQQSDTLRFLEEGLAESFATSSVREGFAFAYRNYDISGWRIAAEIGAVGAGIGLIAYGAAAMAAP